MCKHNQTFNAWKYFKYKNFPSYNIAYKDIWGHLAGENFVCGHQAKNEENKYTVDHLNGLSSVEIGQTWKQLAVAEVHCHNMQKCMCQKVACFLGTYKLLGTHRDTRNLSQLDTFEAIFLSWKKLKWWLFRTIIVWCSCWIFPDFVDFLLTHFPHALCLAHLLHS